MATRLPWSELFQVAQNIFRHKSIANPHLSQHATENYGVIATLLSAGAAFVGLGVMKLHQDKLEKDVTELVKKREQLRTEFEANRLAARMKKHQNSSYNYGITIIAVLSVCSFFYVFGRTQAFRKTLIEAGTTSFLASKPAVVRNGRAFRLWPFTRSEEGHLTRSEEGHSMSSEESIQVEEGEKKFKDFDEINVK